MPNIPPAFPTLKSSPLPHHTELCAHTARRPRLVLPARARPRPRLQPGVAARVPRPRGAGATQPGPGGVLPCRARLAVRPRLLHGREIGGALAARFPSTWWVNITLYGIGGEGGSCTCMEATAAAPLMMHLTG